MDQVFATCSTPGNPINGGKLTNYPTLLDLQPVSLDLQELSPFIIPSAVTGKGDPVEEYATD